MIWTEDLELLLRRAAGLGRLPEGIPREDLPAAAERVRRRSDAVAQYLGLAHAQHIATPSLWATRWNAGAERRRLTEALKKLGWTVSYVEDAEAARHKIASANPHATQLVVIAESSALSLLDRLKANGLTLPFQPEDAALLLLAEELFQATVARMGHPPKDAWVDPIGVTEFQQRALGLPFHPFLLEIAVPTLS